MSAGVGSTPGLGGVLLKQLLSLVCDVGEGRQGQGETFQGGWDVNLPPPPRK